MSKEVKRYTIYPQLKPEALAFLPDVVVDAKAYDALLAERDARLLQVDTLTDWYSNSLDVIREITAALPGAHYMDPPDGGDVSVPEQVRRMAKDAERYRWLLRQAWFQSAFDRYDFDNGGMQHRFERCAAEIIDAALQGAQS